MKCFSKLYVLYKTSQNKSLCHYVTPLKSSATLHQFYYLHLHLLLEASKLCSVNYQTNKQTNKQTKTIKKYDFKVNGIVFCGTPTVRHETKYIKLRYFYGQRVLNSYRKLIFSNHCTKNEVFH